MKRLTLLLALTASGAAAQSTYLNFIRQSQQGTGIVWDMPVAPVGTGPSALALESQGALFQLWTIEQTQGTDHLLDQKLVGAYLPIADIKVITLDPDGKVPRTRVDKPFTVEINIQGLLPGTNLPQAASQVLLGQHIASYATGSTTLDTIQVLSKPPLSSGYISDNGKTTLKFPSSSLKADDATKALGEEHFVVHALSDGSISQTQIASAHVQVWPVACGEIKGIANGDLVRFQTPQVELILNDLYPRSDTYFMIYKGAAVDPGIGSLVKSFPMDRDAAESTVIRVDELDSKLTEDGTYTLALMSDTVYGTEFLCPPVTFQVKRTLHVNAMQVSYSDSNQP